MESRETVLEAVKKRWYALREVDEVWKSDSEVVLTAVQANGIALQFAAEVLKGDREIVLAAVQKHGSALRYATEALRSDRDVVLAAVQKDGYTLRYASEALRADREVVQAAVQQHVNALEFAEDCLLEDPTFATEAKRFFHLIKLTMLSGRSTVVVATLSARFGQSDAEVVLHICRERLGVDVDGSTMELWHGLESVPDDECVEHWPGVQPLGEISEYQLLLRR
eukprot:2652636-Amphidinium_carterae.1